MSFPQKLNAVSRLVIILTIVMYLLTQTFRTIVFGVISLATVALVFMYDHSNKDSKDSKDQREKEAFSAIWSDGATLQNNAALATLAEQGKQIPKEMVVFDETTTTNPFSNVLVTDLADNPEKRPAPPAYNANISESILANAKQLVKDANAENPDVADKLFRDLGEQFVFEQSMRPFYSNPSTTIPNDQEAFSDFCYGSMISCKEGNMFACARNMASRQTLM